jgi:hypothetical protein
MAYSMDTAHHESFSVNIVQLTYPTFTFRYHKSYVAPATRRMHRLPDRVTTTAGHTAHTVVVRQSACTFSSHQHRRQFSSNAAKRVRLGSLESWKFAILHPLAAVAHTARAHRHTPQATHCTVRSQQALQETHNDVRTSNWTRHHHLNTRCIPATLTSSCASCRLTPWGHPLRRMSHPLAGCQLAVRTRLA